MRRLERGAGGQHPERLGRGEEDFKTLCSLDGRRRQGPAAGPDLRSGTGTTVEVGGKAKGTLPGKATADAILSTWIGQDPGPGADFKKAVLGG